MSLDSVTHVSGISVTYVLGCSAIGKRGATKRHKGRKGERDWRFDMREEGNDKEAQRRDERLEISYWVLGRGVRGEERDWRLVIGKREKD